jgi:hypothetical protein
MENQISIEEYTKSLKPKGNKNEKWGRNTKNITTQRRI